MNIMNIWSLTVMDMTAGYAVTSCKDVYYWALVSRSSAAPSVEHVL